jgi:hypothetical protein
MGFPCETAKTVWLELLPDFASSSIEFWKGIDVLRSMGLHSSRKDRYE